MQVLSILASLIFFCFGFFNFGQSEGEKPSRLTGLVTLEEMAEETMHYKEALANSQPTVVEFYADWCQTCRAIAPTLAQFHQQYPEVNFVMINVDHPHSSQAMRRYQVTGVPHLIFLRPDGTVAETLVGDVPKPILENVFERLI